MNPSAIFLKKTGFQAFIAIGRKKCTLSVYIENNETPTGCLSNFKKHYVYTIIKKTTFSSSLLVLIH